MSKKLAFVLALVLTLLPLTSNALGLGEIKLHSALNQPLNASIAVVGAAADEISSLHVKVASAGQFQQAGIPMSAALNQLKFEVVPGPNGTASVHITTTQPFREPFLDVLLDATWDNGELIREYTVFLNPPNFEAASKPAAAAPAATPLPAATTTPASAAAAPAAASNVTPAQPVAPAAALPPSAPVAPATPTPVAAPVAAEPSGNYGPIQRGETLTEIALKVRPQGVTLNQMMIAIYRANPRVFIHNINLMKAGLVLRIPSADDIQAVSVAEANSDVRTQTTAWRNRRAVAAAPTPSAAAPAVAEKPALTLVAPSAAEKSTENQVPGAGAGGTGIVGTKGAAAATHAGKSAAATATTAAKAPIKLANAGLAAVQSQAQAGKQVQAPGVTTKVTPLKTEKPEASKPLPKKKIAAPVSPPAESGGFVGSPIFYLVIALIIIFIALIVIRVLRKQREDAAPFGGGSGPKGSKGPKSKPLAKTPPADAEKWDAQESAASDAAANASPASPAAAAVATAGVAAAATGAGNEEPDPLAESDFHMAYGLYDQAAEVLKKGLAQNPGRRDLKMKLLEVYFTAGDREKFLDTAHSLRHDMGTTPDKDWDKVAIMGHQIAADDALFSGNGATAAAPAVSVDIPLESTVSGEMAVPEVDPLAGAFNDVQPASPAETAAAQPKEDSHVIDFELPDIEPTQPKTGTGTKTLEATPDKPGKAAGTGSVNADFGTDSQVEFDKALKELSDFVNTNVPVQEEAATSAGAALSLSADAIPPASDTSTGTRSATGTGGETTGLNEIGTKLDLARAYIDMGDSEGAKNILREVLEEGDREQTQEAQKLMQKLP